MSDIFDDTLKAAAESFFHLPGSEVITYFPAGGAARRIKAVISRSSPDDMPGIDGGSVPMFTVLVKNDSDDGIASESVDTGGDKITCARRVAERPASMRLLQIINHDAGMVLLAAG